MKKTRITDGIRGMMTYVARIAVGKARMKVTFSDGSISATGSKPAVFTTDNYIVQKGIEQSEQFKSGLIFVYSSYPLDEDLKVETNEAVAEPEAETPKDSADGANVSDGHDSENAEPVTDDEADAEQEASEQPVEATDPAPQTLDAGADGEKQLTRVEFEVNEYAKDYLEENFGAVRSKLRTRADIIAFGEEHGVEIVFI